MSQDLPQWDLYPYVFCDSLLALHRAWDAGLAQTTKVKTFSPIVAAALGETAIPLGGEADIARLDAFTHSSIALNQAVFARARDLGFDHFAAICVVRATLVAHSLITRALFVEPADLTEPRLTIGVAEDSEKFNPYWPKFLASNPQHRQWLVSWSPPQEPALRQLHKSERLARLQWPLIRYQAETWWRRKRPAATPRPVVLTVRVDDFGAEAVMAFSRNGYEIRSGKAKATAVAVPAELAQIIQEVVRPFAVQWFDSQLVPAICDLVEQGVARDLTQHLGARPGWQSVIQALPPGSIALSSYPTTPEISALAAVCRAAQIPFISSQHGFNRELNKDHDFVAVTYENTSADITIGFNQRSIEKGELSPYRSGRVAAFGFPPERASWQQRRTHRISSGDQLEVLYVYTGLLRGNKNLLTGGIGDIARSGRECHIVSHCLAKSPHEIKIKTYPSGARYTEPDPVWPLARSHNVGVFDDRIDLRFIAHQYDLLITSRMSSTVSRCLISGRMLAFINFRDNEPIEDALFDEMAKGYLVFEYCDPNFTADFAAFLQRDKASICQEWQRKALARKHFMDTYVGYENHKVGDAIFQEIMRTWPNLAKAAAR